MRMFSLVPVASLVLGCGLLTAQTTASPTSLSWNKVAVGNTGGQKTVTLTNSGSGAINISSIGMTGTDATDFAVFSNTCGTTLAVSASCTANIVFRPTTAGTRTATLNFNDSDSSSPQQVSLSGLGTAPTGVVSATPGSLTFSSTNLGSTSTAQTITLTNNTASSVTLNAQGLSDPTDFSVSSTTCGSTLGASASCTANVAFTPSKSGALSGTWSIASSASSTPLTVNLTGTGAGVVSSTPGSLSFSSTNVGSTSTAQTITLTNNTASSVTLSAAGLSDPTDFSVSSTTCGSTLGASASCAANVVFTPSKSGALSGTWSITSSASSTPLTAALSGTGAISGAVTVSPTSLSWNKVAVGNTSGQKTVTLTNSDSGAITINSIGVTGTDAADFAVSSNTCGTTLAASASCTANIVFKPTTSGTRTATLNFNDSDSSSPQQVSLSGLGTAPTGVVSATPGSLSFGTTNVGSTSTAQTITVTNNTASSVTLSAEGLSDQTDFSISTTTCGSTLGVSASCTANIAFTPTNSGTLSGTWSITSSASSTPVTVDLGGIGAPGGTATLSPSSYDFPTQGAGTVSAPVAFTLTNSQSGTVNITNISISNTVFTQSNNCGSSLAVGASCTISVQFAPPTSSAQSATLSVTDDASNSPQTASLTGNDTTVTLKVKPQNVAFGPQLLGRPSNPQSVTVTNGTGTPVTISSITESGSAFTETNTCIPNGSSTGSVAAFASCSISVIFDPSTAGSLTGSVTITTSSPAGAVAIPLVGTGEVGDTAPSMIITPQASCILPGQSQQFAAAFRNTSNTAVNWYVNSVQGGNSSSGTISANGLYLAPLSTGNFTVEGVDSADTLSMTTSINVTNTPTFSIYPYTASIPPGAQQTFQGQFCNAPDNDVIVYSVDNIQGGNAKVGTITNDGVYTAPATAGTHIVRATDSTLNKGSGAVVTVFSSIVVDFGSRTIQKYPISAGILGVNHVDGLHSPADMGLMAQAGVTLSRTYANIPTVYATQTPDWTKIDPLISKLQSQGMHVLMEVALTPPWLQPNPNLCGTSAVPTDINAWAQIAASYVAHMDATFPGVVTDYEIENEPNANGLCGNSNKLNVYLQIYAAAAPLMKQQAATDGTTIRVGGPTTAGMQSSWISALLTNASTAPYVDFVSYHDYLFGTNGVNAAWDTYNGNVSIYDMTQVTEANRYSQAASVVAAGSQPGGATTPIYIDEYNLNSAFIQNCCQNDPTYAPIWNALYVSDVLDQVYYRGTAAVPQQLTYFAANAYPYFCMIGTWDSQMDCQYTTNSSPVPYPQYYAYQLMASPNYLGLNSGGYMAASVSPGYAAGGIETTAFYTATQDSILIVNPTSTAYPSITVTINNSGLSSPSASLFQIVGGNSITSNSVTLTPSGSAYTTTISVPAYTVLGISIQGQ